MGALRYTSKDFDSIKSAMLAQIPVLAPGWTNLNEGELGMALLNLLAGTGDMLSYYVDRLAEEMYLPTAQLRESVAKLTRLIDYKLHRPVAAKTRLRFTLPTAATANLLIPRYTQARTADGTVFTTKTDATLYTGQTYVEVDAYQGEFVLDVFTGNGSDVQTFVLTKSGVAQNFLDLSVSGALWTEDTSAVSPKETRIFEVLTDVNDTAILRFSRFLGDVPVQNETVQASYITTRGAAGNLGSGLVNTLVTKISGGDALTVTNVTISSGGKDRESLDEARVNAPRQLRTLNRAVTLSDYVDLLETFPKVAKAQAINHNGYVECYVAPEGGGDLYVRAPTLFTLTPATTGGTLAAGTYYVLMTFVDQYGGETPATTYNPPDRAVVAKYKTAAVASGTTGKITVATGYSANAYPANVTGWNLYIGASATTMRLAYSGALSTVSAVLSALPASTAALAPTANSTGPRAESGTLSLRQAAETFLEDRRMLGTVFSLYNPTYVPVDVTATVTIYSNYSQAAVKGAVDSALTDFFKFENRAFGDDVTLASLYPAVMSVPGVRTVSFAAPAADVVINDGQLASRGVVTLTMSGGVA